MWWNAIAGAVQGVFEGQGTRAVIAAGNRVRQTNADASNKVRQASNLAAAAEGNLARWTQSVNNNRRLDAGGEEIEANIVNARRQMDAGLTANFTTSIATAEQEGAAAAAQAVAGIDGSVVDMINGSVALRDSIVRQGIDKNIELTNYDTAARAGSIMSQMIGGLDGSIIMDKMDYTVDVARFEQGFNDLASALRGAAEHMGAGDYGRGKAETQNEQATTTYKQDWDAAVERGDFEFGRDPEKSQFNWGQDDSANDGDFLYGSGSFTQGSDLYKSEGSSWWSSN